MVLLMAAPILTLTQDEVEGGRPIFQRSIEILEGFDRLSYQKPMDIQVAPSGRILVLFQTFASYSWDVSLVYSDDEGKTWSDVVRIDDVLEDGNATNDDTNQLNPRMVLGDDGTVFVVWEDWRNWLDNVFSRPVDIRFAKSADGSSFGASKVITPLKSINTWDAFRPDISINDDGRLFVVWLDEKDAGAYKNIWSSYSDDDGDSWSNSMMINTDGKDYRDHLFPRCAMYGDKVYVTWHDERNTTMGTKPFLAISDDSGETFQEEFPITTDTQVGAHRENAVPVVDDAGNLYITWMDDRTEVDEVFFTSSEDNGATFSQDRRVFSIPDDVSDFNPFITATGDGKLGLVWEREIPFGYQLERDVFYINSSDGGRTWDPILRVDHNDRFKEDRSDQRDVVVTYDNNGRALCVYSSNWNKDGVIGSSDYNLFFTRHSVSLSAVNHLPHLLQPDFLGESEFNHIIGNTDTIYNFTMTYWDEDNDEPAEGFPRVQIFRDPEGADPLYDEWSIMERVNGTKDYYFMDGVNYFIEMNVTEQGQFYWMMQIRDEVDPTIISSDVFFGPLIDTTPPTLEITSPEEAVWYAQKKIECRVIVRDTGGAGVNTSIKFMKTVRGLDYFETEVRIDGINRIDNDTIEAWANISLSSGTENYVKFVAWDRVGNGKSHSEPINIWLDPDVPYAVEPEPRGDFVNIYGLVNCSITWRDANPGSTITNHTGLDPSSMMYSYKTTSEDFSEWMEPAGYYPIGEESYRIWAFVEFPDEGVYNFIRWKASDIVGNEFVTQGYRVTVDIPENYAPEFKGIGYPSVISSPTPHIWWDEAFDEENDPLYYKVQLLKYPTELILTDMYELGRRTYFDIPDSEALIPEHYILRIHVNDELGGEDVMDHVFQVIETGLPPPGQVPRFSTFNTSDPNSTISWERSADDDGDIDYFIRIGTEPYQGDVLEWKDMGKVMELSLEGLDLGIGIYSVQIMAFGNGNFSRVTAGELKINDYSLKTTHPQTHVAFKGEKGFKMTAPINCYIINMATYSDTVIVTLSGEMIDEDWAYLTDSETATHNYLVNSSKELAVEEALEFRITVAAPESAKSGEYTITYTLRSEDGITILQSGEILITLKNAPVDSTGESFTDDLSGVITDILPFLKGLPPGFVIAIFFLIVILVVGGIVFLGIFISKKREQKKKMDPLAEQRRVYKEIYGREPTQEELQLMQAQTDKETVDDFISEGAEKKEEESVEEGELQEPPEEGEEVEGSEPPKEGEGTLEKLPEEDHASSGDKATDDLLDRLFD
jgi:hypothetical protein